MRDNEVGHLQIDNRNTCAMFNFLHNPCCADGNKAINVSNQMKNKININIKNRT